MDRLVSRKLATAALAIFAIVGLMVLALLQDSTALTEKVELLGVTAPVFFWAILVIAGLGGFNVWRQAQLDELEDEVDPEPPATLSELRDELQAARELIFSIRNDLAMDDPAVEPRTNGEPPIG